MDVLKVIIADKSPKFNRILTDLEQPGQLLGGGRDHIWLRAFSRASTSAGSIL